MTDVQEKYLDIEHLPLLSVQLQAPSIYPTGILMKA